MKKFTQEEFDKFRIDRFGYKLYPTEDYSLIKEFDENCDFDKNCKFGFNNIFDKNCQFDAKCKFESRDRSFAKNC